MNHLRLVLLVSALATLPGCGPSITPIDTAPVSGTATFNGKPLKDYRVFFYNETAAAPEPANGLVQADGSFTLSVREPGDGAMIGPNKIWLTYDPKLPDEVPGMETGLPPPKPSVVLPKKFNSATTSGLMVEVPKEGLKDYKIELN